MQDYDFEKIKIFVNAYIETHYDPDRPDDDFLQNRVRHSATVHYLIAPALAPTFKFKPEGETFSKMLRRLMQKAVKKIRTFIIVPILNASIFPKL